MIKKLFKYMTLLAGLTACSVEDIEAPSGLGPDGELTVNLAVPEMETVSTRGDVEFDVTDITMVVLSGTNVEYSKTYPLASTGELTATQNDNEYQLKCTLSPSLRTKSNLKFYFIANLPADVKVTDFNEKGEGYILGSMNTASYANADGNLTMAGVKTLSELLNNQSVSLARNIAKVTVTDGTQDEKGNWTLGSTVYPVEVYGTASTSSVAAAAITGTTYIGTPTSPSSVSFTGKDAVYVHRTSNPGRDTQTRPFMIVKAPYPAGSTDYYYYRLEFENPDKDGKLSPLHILSNHHYQVIVEEVKGKGDATPEEAVKNPTSLVSYTIYDFCPEAYNMISDGTRELGVPARLSHNGNPTTEANPEYMYVKLYSEEAYEMTNPVIDVKANVNWLTFGTPTLYNGAEGTPGPDMADTYKGVIYRVPVNFNKTLDPGQLDGKIFVTWKGLQREVPVTWTREFDASDLCKVRMIIYDNTGEKRYDTNDEGTDFDYWKLIRDENKLNGLSVEQNNGKIRNEGLHFPVNYGGTSGRWEYVYVVEFNNLNNSNEYDWKLSADGLSGISFTEGDNLSNTNRVSELKGTTSGKVKFIIRQDGSVANWNYEVGTLKFEISKPNEENYVPYELDLYHTGFFDNPEKFRKNTYRVDDTEKDQFLYYEVIQGLSGDYYWLDRNLGASSAEYYIEADGDVTYYGRNSEPRGGYYKAASYNKGGNPKMYTDLCPPGFEIPRVDVWNLLRNSAEFIMSREGTSYLTQFTNAKGQTVYFPRSRYYDATGAKNGESRAGYYWTQTASDGMEKDQIGNWLRYLKFSGSISSYDNAEVEGRNSSKGWALSVRCVNTVASPQITYRTAFNVSGATHVFLYSETDGVDNNGNPITIRNSVTNWPGTSIGNYITMGNEAGTGSGTQLFNFVYESPTTHPTQFYVIFTFRDKDGIWHTMSKADDGTTLYSKDKAMSELKGWKVIGDTWNGKTTALYGTWKCNFQGTTATVTYEDPTSTPPIIEPLPDELTVYYSNPNKWDEVYVYAYNGDDDKNAAWPGVKMTKQDDGKWMGKISSHFNYIIFNNNSGSQTGNLTVEKKDNYTYN